jgi:hypothetical protein
MVFMGQIGGLLKLKFVESGCLEFFGTYSTPFLERDI